MGRIVAVAAFVVLGSLPAIMGLDDYRTLIWRGNHGWARPDAPLAAIEATLCWYKARDGWVHFWPARQGMTCTTIDDPGDPP